MLKLAPTKNLRYRCCEQDIWGWSVSYDCKSIFSEEVRDLRSELLCCIPMKSQWLDLELSRKKGCVTWRVQLLPLMNARREKRKWVNECILKVTCIERGACSCMQQPFDLPNMCRIAHHFQTGRHALWTTTTAHMIYSISTPKAPSARV